MDRGNFGSLLRGMGYCSAARSRSRWKPVEVVEVVRKQWKMSGSGWKTGKGLEGVQEVREGQEEVQKRSRRPWESAEEVERHGK